MCRTWCIILVIVKLVLADNDLNLSQQVEIRNFDGIINDLFKDKVNTIKVKELPSDIAERDNCSRGKCVPYYLCTNNTQNTTEVNLINVRFGNDKPLECIDYLSVCCEPENQLHQPISTPTTSVSAPDECGYRNSFGVGFRIMEKDGEAQYAEFPWMVALLTQQWDGNKFLNIYICGGSLIHPKAILTASHCVVDKHPLAMKARAGEWDTQTTNELWPHQDRGVSEICAHPDYYGRSLYNDIALVFVRDAFTLAENVQTICLPPPKHSFDHHRCIASGWGQDEFGRSGMHQVILKKVELPIVSDGKCEGALQKTRLGHNFRLHESFLCAGGEHGKDTCNGDGGSPLVCPIGEGTIEQYYLAGIVAWGIGCGEYNIPGVYVNVGMFRNWIDQHMAVRNFNAGSYIPKMQ